METHKELLINDGYSAKIADWKINQINKQSMYLLKNTSSQGKLEKKLMGYFAIDSHDEYVLPGICELAPFDFDAGKFILSAVKEENKPALSTFYLLRYFDLWSTDLSDKDCKKVLEKSFELNKNAKKSLSYYSDKVFDRFKKDPSFLEKISEILQPPNKNSYLYPLPIFSFLNEENLTRYFDRASPLIENPHNSDVISPVRYANRVVGICPDLESFFSDTLICNISEEIGNVTLLYVDDDVPVAAIKWHGRHSVLGLRNVQDSQGRFPIVAGGVYCTDSEVIDLAKKAFNHQGKWAKLKLEHLPLRPMRFTIDSGIRVKSFSDISRKVEDNMNYIL